MSGKELKGKITLKARALGFDLVGFAGACVPEPESGRLGSWLERGYQGSMGWIARNADRRSDPALVLPGVKTIVSVGINYYTSARHQHIPGTGKVSRYAWGDDYHDVIAARLDALLAWMREHSTQRFDARAYVDTGPVQERVYARHSGIGWIGKNTCVINPEVGSWIFLAEIICSLPLEVDEPALDQCGTCALCIEACPTRALVEPGVLDSTRCISYLTIEQRGPIPDELTTAVGLHVYGCDVCQEVCPWNQMAPSSGDPAWQRRPAWTRASVSALARLDDAELRNAMRGSSMRRTKVTGLRRNLRVALENAKRL